MLYHLISTKDWASVQGSTEYAPPSFTSEGFIHLSTWEQVAPTANRFYSGRADLILLQIDDRLLRDSVRWEDNYGHGEFPHLYAPLRLSAVRIANPYLPDRAGIFSPPKEAL